MQAAAQPASPSAARPTAVLYVHWAGGPDAEANLELFAKAGAGLDDNVQYRIILATRVPMPQAALPRLPLNARCEGLRRMPLQMCCDCGCSSY